MPRLTPEQQLVIYRVTQESLSNIVQHAGARTVDVELSFIGRTVLRVSDDGCGFTGTAATAALGCPACASAPCWPAASCRSGLTPARARAWS